MGEWIPTVWWMRGWKVTYDLKENVEKVTFFYAVTCKFCGTDDVAKFGKSSGGGQRYTCRGCKRTFVDNNAPAGMRFSAKVIATALNLFYEGTSLEAIRRHIRLEHGDYPGHATVYEWIVKYSKKAVGQMGSCQVNAGPLWAADETVLKVAGGKTKTGSDNTIWFWDVIDEDSRFLLASHMSQTRTIRDAETLFRRAGRVAMKPPKFIVTDKLAAYIDGIERVFGADTTHVQSRGMASSTHNNVIERFHGTLKDRTKVMRGLHSKESARLVTDGWLIHYNFFRPHQSLKGRTPAEVAGVEAPFKSWADVVNR